MELKEHWENVYTKKTDREVSWFQQTPKTSIKLIQELNLNLKDPIIDVGGGNSKLATELFEKGYSDLSVLDISGTSIEKMQTKLGATAKSIHWIESNILEFESNRKYKLWHDRAAFHFITSQKDKMNYKENLVKSLDKNGYFILSTFSIDGPEKCSGLGICQYDLSSLKSIFHDSFKLLNIFNEDHHTPFGTTQNFIFSIWKIRP